MFYLGIIIGALWFRSSVELYIFVAQDPLGGPMFIYKNPWILKIASRSPTAILLLAAFNGFLIGGWIDAIFLPIMTYTLQLGLHVATRNFLSLRVQWSKFFNPIIHIVVFMPAYLIFTFWNIGQNLLV